MRFVLAAFFLFLGVQKATSNEPSEYKISETGGYVEDGELILPSSSSIEYPRSGIKLGMGWSNVSSKGKFATCIDFSREESGGQNASVTVTRIEDRDSFRREIGVSYSATAKAKFDLGSASASAKTSFLQKTKIENHSLNLLVKGDVVNGVAYVAPPQKESTEETIISLNEVGEKALKEGILVFQQTCGDSFVSAIERGSELYVVYGFQEDKKAESTEATKSLGASGGYMGFSGSLNYDSSKLEEQISNRSVGSIKYFHSAHRGLTLPADEQGIQSSLQFLGSALELADSYPFRVHLTKYSDLPNFPSVVLSTSPLNEKREAYRIRLESLVSTIDHVLKFPDSYGIDKRYYGKSVVDDEAVELDPVQYFRRLQDNIVLEISKVENETRDCLPDPDVIPTEALLKSCLPKRNGQYWDYFYRSLMPVHNDYLRAKTREEISTENGFDSLISSLIHKKNTFVANIYRKAKRCGIGRGWCGYHYIREGCNIHKSHHRCRQYDRELAAARTKKANFQQHLDKILDADSRFIFWIDETSRRRRENNEINGYLSNAELDVFRSEIYCQYEGFHNGELAQCPKIEQSIRSGERLKLTYRFNPKYKEQRDQEFNTLLNDQLEDVKSRRKKLINDHWDAQFEAPALKPIEIDPKSPPILWKMPANTQKVQDLLRSEQWIANNDVAVDPEVFEKFIKQIEDADPNLYGQLNGAFGEILQRPDVLELTDEVFSLRSARERLEQQNKTFWKSINGPDAKSFNEDGQPLRADFNAVKYQHEANLSLKSIKRGEWESTQPLISYEADFDVVVESF